MSADQNISTIMNLIKGESSFWANRNLSFSEDFGWQDEYFAVSVSQSHLDLVNNYINITRKSIIRKKLFSRNMMNLFSFTILKNSRAKALPKPCTSITTP